MLRHRPDWTSDQHRFVTINEDTFRIGRKVWESLLNSPEFQTPGGYPDWIKITVYVKLHGKLVTPGGEGVTERPMASRYSMF